jgi:hypothetical protein
VTTNPFGPLQAALEVIAREGRVLPATGQAMEDLMRPDHEEVIDRLRSHPDDKVLDVIFETPNRDPYVQLPELQRTKRHPLRFFLDGSARTFFLGDVVEGNRRSAVHVSQIGAAAVFRNDDGSMRIACSEHKIVLMLDAKAVSFGEQVKAKVAAAGARFQFLDTMENDGESEKTAPGKEPRSRAAHKAHHAMAELEERLGRVTARANGQWLVLDGSLGKDLHKWKDIQQYVGVTKSFSREPQFSLPGKRGSRQANLYELLSELPFSARTSAFAIRAGKAVQWYVRLREQRTMDYPLMGVIKVEYPNLAEEPVSSAVIDEISSALIAERQATPHGKDVRWHAHLYAVFLAEQAVKNGFISTEALKAGLRWPVSNEVSR